LDGLTLVRSGAAAPARPHADERAPASVPVRAHVCERPHGHAGAHQLVRGSTPARARETQQPAVLGRPARARRGPLFLRRPYFRTA